MGSKYLGYGSNRLADRPSELRINVFQRLGNIMLGLFLGQMAYRCLFLNISMCDHPSTRLNEALDCVVTLGNSRNQGPEALAHATCKGFYCKLVSSQAVSWFTRQPLRSSSSPREFVRGLLFCRSRRSRPQLRTLRAQPATDPQVDQILARAP